METVVLRMNPVPASRPRVSRYGVHYGKKYAQWKLWMKHNLVRGTLDSEDDLLVCITHIGLKARTSKLSTPNGDVDNFDKAALDAITTAKGYWIDDKQVRYLFSEKRFAEKGEEPRTEVSIYSP